MDTVDLWMSLNRLLVHVLLRVPEDKAGVPCRIGIADPVPLTALVARYVERSQELWEDRGPPIIVDNGQRYARRPGQVDAIRRFNRFIRGKSDWLARDIWIALLRCPKCGCCMKWRIATRRRHPRSRRLSDWTQAI